MSRPLIFYRVDRLMIIVSFFMVIGLYLIYDGLTNDIVRHFSLSQSTHEIKLLKIPY